MQTKRTRKLYAENENFWRRVKLSLFVVFAIFCIKLFIPQKTRQYIRDFFIDTQCSFCSFFTSFELQRFVCNNDLNELREENIILKTKIKCTENILQENLDLRKILKMDRRQDKFLVARVVPSLNFEYSQAITINVGTKHGVLDSSVVINESGLVGRVIKVLESCSIVLLSTDVNFSIPVYFLSDEESNSSCEKLAIVRGNTSGLLSVITKHSDFSLKEGDKVYSSGHGGIFPHGVLVGTVNSENSINPVFDKDRLKFLCVYTDLF